MSSPHIRKKKASKQPRETWRRFRGRTCCGVSALATRPPQAFPTCRTSATATASAPPFPTSSATSLLPSFLPTPKTYFGQSITVGEVAGTAVRRMSAAAVTTGRTVSSLCQGRGDGAAQCGEGKTGGKDFGVLGAQDCAESSG